MGRFSDPKMWRPISIFLMVLLAASGAAGRIIYVDGHASRGANDGSSWADACNYLQDALADANASPKPVEIRVAQAIYKPDQGASQTPGDRNASFQLIDGVTLKGGYAGFGEPDPNARDIEAYETILSGDLADNDIPVADPCDLLTEPTRADNSYTIVTAGPCSTSTVLDGFTVSCGNAIRDRHPLDQRGTALIVWAASAFAPSCPSIVDCTFVHNSAYIGGALYVLGGCPKLTRCRFLRNAATRGGALLNSAIREGGEYESGCQFLLKECVFASNHAVDAGGGMYISGGSPDIIGCTFEDNRARSGGGMYNDSSSPTVANCTFSSNSASGYGGGMHNESLSNPTIINCTFIGNSASYGAGMSNQHSSYPVAADCVFMMNQVYNGYGGGMHNSHRGDPTLTRCTFSANYASLGAAMFCEGSNPTLTNCVLSGNRADYHFPGHTSPPPWFANGGAIFCGDSNLTLANCTLSENRASEGAVMCHIGGGVTMLTHCILRDGDDEIVNAGGSTANVAYSNVRGGWPGESNIDADPCFVDPGRWVNAGDPNQIAEPDDPNPVWVDGDYHLKSQAGRWDPKTLSWVKDDVTSPCIDAGDRMSPIGHEPFPNGGIINMGAYGGTVEASKSYFGESICETVVAGDINGDCKVDFRDFAIMALHWLEGDER